MGYSYLKVYSEKVKKVADECIRLMLEDKNDYPCMIIIEDVLQQFGLQSIDNYLLEEMLAEREEVKDVSIETAKNCSRIFLTRADSCKEFEVEDEYMEMKIPGGKIVIERVSDKNFYDAYIYYVDDKNEDKNFDLATISANNGNKIQMYVYENQESDEPTMEIGWDK